MVTPYGRAVKNGSTWDYEYNLTDHLGNVRAVIRKGSNNLAELVQQKHYYPFGMEMSNISLGTGTNKYLYNGKEIQDDFNLYWYDYGARFYDPQLARFHSVDPKATDYYFQSPYAYAANNPILFIDKNGEFPFILPLVAKGVAIAGTAVLTSYAAYKAGEGIREGLENQRRRERHAKEDLKQSQANIRNSIEANYGGSTPEGDNYPKNPNGKLLEKIGSVVGLTAVVGTEVWKMYNIVQETKEQKNIHEIPSNINLSEFESVVGVSLEKTDPEYYNSLSNEQRQGYQAERNRKFLDHIRQKINEDKKEDIQ